MKSIDKRFAKPNNFNMYCVHTLKNEKTVCTLFVPVRCWRNTAWIVAYGNYDPWLAIVTRTNIIVDYHVDCGRSKRLFKTIKQRWRRPTVRYCRVLRETRYEKSVGIHNIYYRFEMFFKKTVSINPWITGRISNVRSYYCRIHGKSDTYFMG